MSRFGFGTGKSQAAKAVVVTAPKKKRSPRTTHAGKPVLREVVCEYVVKNPGQTALQIAEGINRERSNINAILRGLVEEGRIQRERVPTQYQYVYSATRTTAENVEKTEAILQYVSDHIEETYSVYKLAEELKMPVSSAYKEVKALVKRGLIPANFNKGDKESVAKKEEPTTQKPAATAPVKNEGAFAELVFTYIRETRNTDLLSFLTWLENRQ